LKLRISNPSLPALRQRRSGPSDEKRIRLASRVHLSNLFVLLWPYIHWSIAIGFAILAVEALLPRSERQATVPRNTTGCNPCRGLLDWPPFSARRLFSAFRKLQQNLRNSWSSHCADGLALLDWLCHAGGRRTQFRTSEDQQRGQDRRSEERRV